jgi:histidinol-phosphatase
VVATRPLADDLALAHRIVDATAPISMGHFTRGVEAIAKTDGSPVTQADHDVERVILEMLAAERPDDSVLSEESGARGDASARRWIIDPIDGTANFAAGKRTWTTMFALEDGGELVLGMIDLPAFGVRYWATRGGGAFSRVGDGEAQRLTMHDCTELSSARATSNAAAVLRGSANVALLQQHCVWMEPTVGLAFDVIGGTLDIALAEDHGESWDHAGLIVIFEEAGGAFFDLAGGRRHDTRHGVYTVRSLVGPLRTLLNISATEPRKP